MMLGVLLRAKWQTIRNYGRSNDGGVGRVLVFVVLGLAFWIGIFAASHWFLAECLALEPIGEIVVRRLLAMALLMIFSILTFSNLVAAFSTFYLADDLQLLVSRPIPPNTLYTARFVENSVYSAWMTLIFSLPIFVAAGVLLDAPWMYYVSLTASLIALSVIPTALAVTLSLVLASIFSARRTRNVMIFVGAMLFAVLYILFRSLEPEKLLNPDNRASMLEVLSTLQGSDPIWLPSTWAHELLWRHLGHSVYDSTHPAALLLTATAAAFFIGGWFFRALYRVAFSKAQEGLQREEGIPLANRRNDATLAQIAERFGRREETLTMPKVMWRKDLRVFIRDTAQWSQLILLIALTAIYLVNFRYIRTIGDGGIIGSFGLHFLNMALSGFVVVAMAVRFVFPTVSLEGRAFWLIRRSPNSMWSFLLVKWLGACLPLVLLANGLVLLTNLVLGADPVLIVSAVLTVTPLAVGLVGLGVGIGARYPRFNVDNAAKIAMGFGGILYMLLGIGILVIVVVLSSLPTMTTLTYMGLDRWPSPRRITLGALAIVGVYLIPAVAAWIALRVGANHLERRSL